MEEIEKKLTLAFQTNAIGPALVVEAFAPLLRKSEGIVRIVNVSSGAGSITLKTDESNPYRKMKTVCQVTSFSFSPHSFYKISLGRRRDVNMYVMSRSPTEHPNPHST